MSSQPLPPTYSQLPETQLLITPSDNRTQFQNGYLGADTTTSVDGEVHVKGAAPGDWSRLTVSFVTTERYQQVQVPLFSHTVNLYAAQDSSHPGTSSSPSSRPPTTSSFSIPLTNDTPQAVRTPVSSLVHQIVAKLYPSDPTRETIVTYQDVDIRRYSSISSPVPHSMPYTYTLDSPARLEVQIPRIIFRLGDIIPIYVTVPVPVAESVIQDGLRLRNIKVELTRTITVLKNHTSADRESTTSGGSDTTTSSTEATISEYSLLSGDIPPASPRSDDKVSESFEESTTTSQATQIFKTTCTRSGAAARFHSSRPLRVRLLVRAMTLPSSPTQVATDAGALSSSSVDCSITQHTILHSVDFSLDVLFSFLYQRPSQTSTSSATGPAQQTAHISIPVTLCPSLTAAARGSEEIDMERAYHKKFDKPPTETNREPTADVGPPGPSASGAPPPFDERDAPPPPFVLSDPQQQPAGTSRLPTFLESEAHYVVPQPGPSNSTQVPYAGYTSEAMGELTIAFTDQDRAIAIEGEGRLFGFRPDEQFDGLESSFGSGAEPPPSIESVQGDTDLTALADLVDQPERALEVIGRSIGVVNGAFVNGEGSNLDQALGLDLVGEQPAPPFVDYPADPPPGIDMEYRTSPYSTHLDSEGQLLPPPISPVDPPPSIEDIVLVQQHNSNAEASNLDSRVHSVGGARPPPYLTASEPSHTDGQHGPPPYVDLRPQQL